MFNTNDEALKKLLKELKVEQNKDEYCKKIIQGLQGERREGDENCQIYKEILFQREKENTIWRIVIPGNLIHQIIHITHNKMGHPGVYKTLSHLKRFYFWKYMQRDVRKYVLTCDMCQRVKYLTIAMEGQFEMVNAEAPSDLATVDFYGPLPRGRGGVEYIFVILDAFSKIVRLYPLKKATTQIALKKIIEHYIPDCGKPNKILSDHGTQFTSPRWREELEKLNIKVLFSSIRHPQSNPTERVMREIGRLFRTFCVGSHASWAQYVEKIQTLLNSTTHFSTAFTPHELHFGKPLQDEILKIIDFPPKPTIDHKLIITLALENIRKNFENRSKNQKVSSVKLAVGDLVLLRVKHLSNALDKVTKKFFHLFEGPYQITNNRKQCIRSC